MGADIFGRLLDRELELEAIGRAVDRAAAGSSGLVVVEGPPGIGKTALMECARERAHSLDMTLLSARGYELERGFAFGAARQMFEAVLRGAHERERATLLDGAASLAIPLFGAGSTPAPALSFGSNPAFALQHGLYWLAVNLADRAPVLLTVDDLHWIDAASQHWLVYLANRLEDLPLLVLAATRPDDGVEDVQLPQPLIAHPKAQHVVPSALSQDAVGVLVDRAFGERADAALASACHHATAGNPHLLGELLATLRDGADAAPEESLTDRIHGLVPEAVARSTLLRLARVSSLARPTARAIAVLGASPELHDVATMTELNVEDAARTIDQLAAANILTSEQRLDFAHPIVRSAVYADIPLSERAQTHRRAASLLRERGSPAEQVAAHLLVAEPVREGWALANLRAAAGEAVARGAPDRAVAFLQCALDAGLGPDERLEILHELGRAQIQGDPVRGVETLRSAHQLTTTPLQRVGIARDMSFGLLTSMRASEALTVLDEAADDIVGEDPELRLLLEVDRFGAAQLDPASAADGAARLRRIADSTDRAGPADTAGRRLLYACLAHQAAMEGHDSARTGAWAERAVGDLEQFLTPTHVRIVYTLTLADRIAPVHGILDRLLSDTVASGQVVTFITVRAMRSHLAMWTGDVARAELEARIALEAGSLTFIPPTPLAYLIQALVAKGESEQAETELQASGMTGDLPDMFLFNILLYARGRLRIARYELEEGVEDLLELGRRLERSGITNAAIYPWTAAAASALARLGRHEQARSVAAESLRSARGWGTPRAIGAALRGHALSERSGPNVRELEASVRELEHSPARLELAESLLELGAALRRNNRRADSRDPLRRCLEVADRCGAQAFAARALQELHATGARPRRAQLSGRDSLTATERNVAELAGQGLTNPQIAQALFVARKTVETHLGRVYRKLDISSREQLDRSLMSAT